MSYKPDPLAGSVASIDGSQRAGASAAELWLESAIAGEPAALRDLLAALGPEVARVVMAILGPSDMGLEDAVQEALLAVVHALPNFRRDCSLRRFANRIAARTALLARRRARAQRARDVTLVPDPAPYCETEPERNRRRRAFVRRMFDALPEAQANALALRFVLGYSLHETSEVLGVPVNTVRSRIRLAKEAMRDELARDPTLLESVPEPR